MARLLLLLPTATYRAADFLTAARALGAEVVVASERRLVSMGDTQLTLDLRRPEAAAEAIVAVAEETSRRRAHDRPGGGDATRFVASCDHLQLAALSHLHQPATPST